MYSTFTTILKDLLKLGICNVKKDNSLFKSIRRQQHKQHQNQYCHPQGQKY